MSSINTPRERDRDPEPFNIAIDSTDLSLPVGDSAGLSAEVRDRQDQKLERAIAWSSSNSAVATVTTSGMVHARSAGNATITATAGAVSASALVSAYAPPVITMLSPTVADVGVAAFTLRVVGRDFRPDSRVLWNGAERPTTYVSATELSAQIAASDVALESAVWVTVRTPSLSERDSDPAFRGRLAVPRDAEHALGR